MERSYPTLDKIIIAALFTFVAFSIFSISITQIAAAVGSLAWLLRTQLSKNWEEQRWVMGIPFLLFILACLLSVANAYDVSYSYKSLKKLLEILIFFWILNCVKENKLRDSLSLLLIASATIAGLLGFYQAWRDGVTIATRAEGTLSVYMTFAGLLMMIGLMALGRVLFKRPRENWLWVCIGIISICLLLTLTRQAWLGFFSGLMFFLFIWKRTFTLIFVISIFSTIITFNKQINSGLKELNISQEHHFLRNMRFRIQQVVSGKDETFFIRVALWKGGWTIFKDYPLTGCGFRCVDLLNSKYPDPTGHIKVLRGMHNNFVQLAVDIGILGLFAWLGIWFYFFRFLYHKAMDLEKDSPDRWLIFASAAAGISFLTGGCFESNFYDSEVAMVLYFLMALPFSGSHSRLTT